MALSKTSFLNKLLLAIIFFLIIVIIAGTLIVKLSPKGKFSPAFQNPQALIQSGKARNLAEPVDTTDIAYYDLGNLRITTLNEDSENMLGIGMVLRPWLAYPAEDAVFYEEIVRKKGVLKAVFQHYFSEHTKEELLSQSEEKIISTLLKEINQNLSLGKISDIYFTDYLFLE